MRNHGLGRCSVGGLIIPRCRTMDSVENSFAITRKNEVPAVGGEADSRGQTALQRHDSDSRNTCQAQGGQGKGSEGDRAPQ